MRHAGSFRVIATSVRKIIVASSLALAILAAIFLYQSGENRDLVAAATIQAGAIAASGKTSSSRAVVLTPAQMAAFGGTPSRPAVGTPNLPTIPLHEYNAAKTAAVAPGGQRPLVPPGPPVFGGPALPIFSTNFPGAVEGENGEPACCPPDVDSAVGISQILQPTNSSIDVWKKTGVHQWSIGQNGFVGNFTDLIGDGRAVYDPIYSRWVVLIDDFSNFTNTGAVNYFLAISQTSDATGAYFVFAPTVSLGGGSQFFDYPELGIDQDAVLITANMFNTAGTVFNGPVAFAIPKAKVYNGIGFSVPVFVLSASTTGSGTLAPPFVEDSNGLDFFVAAPVGSSQTALKKFTMSEAGRANVSFSGPVSIPLPSAISYTTPPPNAPQPSPCTGSSAFLLDTLDGRFQNRSYQFGGVLWQTHAETNITATPRFYQLNTTLNTTLQTGEYFKTGTSSDFNPHIAANTANSAMVTWTSTDPAVGLNAAVMLGGRTSATSVNTMPVDATPVAGSTSCLADNFDPAFGHQRWGDYSAANLDPAQFGFFWVTNEKIAGSASSGTDHWATHHAKATP